MRTIIFLTCLLSGLQASENPYENLMKDVKANFLNLGLRSRSEVLPPPIDLLFVVDESACIGKLDYVMSMRLLKKFLDFFSVSPGTTRVGLITFSSQVKTHFTFDTYTNRMGIQLSILKASTSYAGNSSAFLGKALARAEELFLGNSTFTRPNTKRVLVAITNGVVGNNADRVLLNSVVDRLETHNVKRFVISNGKTIHGDNIDKIKSSSGNKDQQYHFAFKSYEAWKWVNNLLPAAYYLYCNGASSSSWHDVCHRRCQCVNGHIVHCQRVREEANSMTVKDRTRFIDTYIKLTRDPAYRARYENFINIHSRHFFDGIHEASQFFPWHRWFILILENMLKEIDCRVTVPYWDWSLMSHDPFNPMYLFGNRPDGLGGRSDSITNCVVNGKFGQPAGWRIPNGECLRRDLRGRTPNALIVQSLLASDAPFPDFEIFVRVNLHDTVHCLIGGTMCSFQSATVPEFFMHHGMVDKIWWLRQQQSQINFDGIYRPVGRMTATPYTAAEFLNNTALPGHVSVTYDDPSINNARAIMKFLKNQTVDALLQIRQAEFAILDYDSMERFKVKPHERKMAEMFKNQTMDAIHANPVNRVLQGVEMMMGIELPTALNVMTAPTSSTNA